MLLYTLKSNKSLYEVPIVLKKNGHYGIYGGSFNPVHNGHKAIVDYALQSLCIHKLVLLVTPHNPFKDISIYAPFEERFLQVKQKITNPYCIISNFEQIIQSHNTYETVSFLKKKYPTVQFTYIIGSDSASHLHKWHFFKRFARYLRFAIIVRPTHRFSMNAFPAIRFFKQHHIHYDLLLKPLHFISSTELRNPQGTA